MAKKKKRIGRPPSDNPYRVRSVRFRNDEFAQVESAAAAAGVSVSKFIRDAALKAAERRLKK